MLTRARIAGISLRQRLLIPTLLTSGIAPLLSCGANLFLELHNASMKTDPDLRSTADLIGTNEAAALAFQEIQISSLAEDKVPAMINR